VEKHPLTLPGAGGARRFTASALTLALALGAAGTARALGGGAAGPTAPAPAPARSPEEAAAATATARAIGYRGFLPYCSRGEGPTGDFDVEFRLYATPSGGASLWRERRRLRIVDGRIDVSLGTIAPIPEEAYTATFRWVGITVGLAPEIEPRLPVVNTVWVSAESAARAAEIRAAAAPPAAAPASPPAPAPAPVPAPARGGSPSEPGEAPPGCARVGDLWVETAPRAPALWADAAREAQRLGRRLPTREEWHRALLAGSAGGVLDLAGHYEWVEPWLFDPTDSSAEVRLYAGKLNGCSYEELSPELNRFRYRFVVDAR